MFRYVLALCTVSGVLTKPADVLQEYQDSRGQYSFGYSAGDIARSEVRALDGSVRGAFSYLDADGIIQTARYTADGEQGFRIEASNLPEAPKLTPEVAAAAEDHLKAHENVKLIADKSSAKGAIEMKKSALKIPEASSSQKSLLGKEEKIPAVVTTSFNSGKVNLHNRIELKDSPMVLKPVVQGSESAKIDGTMKISSGQISQFTTTPALSSIYSIPTIYSPHFIYYY